jgi:hypothetical protein
MERRIPEARPSTCLFSCISFSIFAAAAIHVIIRSIPYCGWFSIPFVTLLCRFAEMSVARSLSTSRIVHWERDQDSQNMVDFERVVSTVRKRFSRGQVSEYTFASLKVVSAMVCLISATKHVDSLK